MKIKCLFLFALTFGLLTSAFGQNASPLLNPEVQFLDQNGIPLSGGLVTTYAAGTSNLLNSFTDSTAGTPNPNPVVLDAAGRAQIWLGKQCYKLIVASASGTTQFSMDNVCGAPIWLQAGTTVNGTNGFISSSSNPATVGFMRLAFTDGPICWGGAGNGANYGCIGMGPLGSLEVSGVVGGGLIIDRNLIVTQGIDTRAAGFLNGIFNNGSALKHIRVTGCQTPGAAGSTCGTVITWVSPFADANYTATCTGDGIASGSPTIGGLSAKSNTGITVLTTAVLAPAQFSTIDCIAIHD